MVNSKEISVLNANDVVKEKIEDWYECAAPYHYHVNEKNKFETLLIRAFLPKVKLRLENLPWKSPGLFNLAYNNDPAC